MSISSNIAAEYSNRIKAQWHEELTSAYESRDWKKVKIILDKIEEFKFSE